MSRVFVSRRSVLGFIVVRQVPKYLTASLINITGLKVE